MRVEERMRGGERRREWTGMEREGENGERREDSRGEGGGRGRVESRGEGEWRGKKGE